MREWPPVSPAVSVCVSSSLAFGAGGDGALGRGVESAASGPQQPAGGGGGGDFFAASFDAPAAAPLQVPFLLKLLRVARMMGSWWCVSAMVREEVRKLSDGDVEREEEPAPHC